MPFLWVLDFTRSLNHMQLPSLWHPKALSDRWLAPAGPMVWTRCCDDKTLLAAIRERREQSSISPSSNPRSSIDFPRMRNGRQEKAQSDIPMGPVSVCVGACGCVRESTGDALVPRQGAGIRWIHDQSIVFMHTWWLSNSVVYWWCSGKWHESLKACCAVLTQIKWRRRQTKHEIPEGQINLTSHQLHGASLDNSFTSSN